MPTPRPACAPSDLEGTWHSLLAAADVEARGSDGVVGAALQVASIVHLLEEVVGAVDDGAGQADAIGHQRDLTERVRQRSVRAAHLRSGPVRQVRRVKARSRGVGAGQSENVTMVY